MSKIAICSDSHDNLVNITKFLYYCNKEEISTIIHCGDWCAPTVMDFFRENFKGDIYGIYGNVHADKEDVMKMANKLNITMKNDDLELELSEIKFVVTHYPDKAKDLAATGKYQMVLCGHNHKPWKEKIETTYLINPGTLAGLFYRASFAIYDPETKKLDLKILDQIPYDDRNQ